MTYEKLGAFYLGAESGAEPLEAPLLYDARDLTTHAVCIGMTGSGKTGLCLDLLEEAAMDRVPAIVIDPKGDMTNLLLTFPDLSPEDFEPWVDPDQARREEMDLAAFAAAQARLWREGLEKWGQSGDRIRTLRETTDLTIFTPGSEAGLPVSVMGSFQAPTAARSEEGELLRERVSATVSGLLGLIGVDADPLQSREHILLATLFEHFWRAGQDLDLTRLILAIQDPPVRRLGAFDVDTFFPDRDRMALAMRLNNLIAAPGFGSWTRGQALDIPGFLTAPDGRPRHSVFYLAHLSEAERMFFVTLLLGEVIGWMRRQPGTGSLRALLYIDEIFGFLPPVAEPPSKKPFLTLLKQGRAYGLGVVLTTQNPVDLDYKALTNAGTWFVGRLQTERDKGRLLDGLEVAGAGGPSREELESRIASLEKREFLLHNVHEGAPVAFRTRWAMSYLRGPLTRDQVARLMEGREPAAETPAEAGRDPVRETEGRAAGGPVAAAEGPAGAGDGLTDAPPALETGVEQLFLPAEVGPTAAALLAEEEMGSSVEIEDRTLAFRAALLGAGTVHFFHRQSGAQDRHEVACLTTPDEPLRWDRSRDLGTVPEGTTDRPPDGALFHPLPQTINRATKLRSAAKDLADHLYRSRRIALFEAPDLDEFSRPGESKAEFRLRLTQRAREARDEAVERLEERYEKKLDTIVDRIRRARATLERREARAASKKRETFVVLGETVLGALLGRRSTRRASTSLRRLGQTSTASGRAEEAEEDLATLEADARALEEELEERVAEITAEWDASALELEEETVSPRRTDVDVVSVALAWIPYWRVACRAGGDPRVLSIAASAVGSVGARSA